MTVNENDLAHLKTQREIAEAWSQLLPSYPSSKIHVLASVEAAVKVVRKYDDVRVLVCGSLHLVGGVIEVAALSEVAL